MNGAPTVNVAKRAMTKASPRSAAVTTPSQMVEPSFCRRGHDRAARCDKANPRRQRGRGSRRAKGQRQDDAHDDTARCGSLHGRIHSSGSFVDDRPVLTGIDLDVADELFRNDTVRGDVDELDATAGLERLERALD